MTEYTARSLPEEAFARSVVQIPYGLRNFAVSYDIEPRAFWKEFPQKSDCVLAGALTNIVLDATILQASCPSTGGLPMDAISIRGLDKATVLAALYNAAQAQGMGFIQYDPKPMTADEARTILAKKTDFDYLKGRVMKIDLSGDEIAPWCYDRDNGNGMAKRVIDTLRASGDPNNKVIASTHSEHTITEAMRTKAMLGDETKFGKRSLKLGLADMAPQLAPKLDKVLKRG